MQGTVTSFRVLLTLLLSIACSMLVVVWPGWLTDLRAQVYRSFTLSNSGGVTLTQGGSGSTTITATLIFGTGTVSFDVSGLPSGATASFSPTSPCALDTGQRSCVRTLTITTTATTPLGAFPIIVTGRGTAGLPGLALTDFILTVTPPAFDYSLAASPGSVTVTAGGASGLTTITATLLSGATQAVSFSASGLPAGVTAAFSVPSCSPTCSTTVTLTAAPGTATSTSTITVTGTSPNTPNRTTTFTLAVNPPGFDYSLAASPGSVTVTPGSASASTTITATLLSGATQAVSFSVSGLPAGVTAAFSVPSCSPTCSTTVTLTAAPGTPASTSTITVTGTSPNTPNRTATFTLAVNPLFSYSLAASPGNVTVTAGGPPASTAITAALLSGASQAVSFSASGLPAGATAAFSVPSCNPTCSTTLTITVGAGVATSGTFTITVTGTSANTPNQTTTVSLTVNAVPRALTIVSGNNQTGVINAPLPKPLVVAVTPAEPSVTVTWTVTGGAIPSSTSTATVGGLAQITLTLGPTPGPVTVTASIVVAGVVVGASVTFVVNDATSAAISGLKTFSVLGNLAIITTSEQTRNIGLRLAALRRGGGGGVSVSGLSVNVAGQAVPLEAVTTLVTSGPGGGASADRSNPFGGLGIFLNGQGSFGDQDGSVREPGFKFHTQGLTLGSDYRVTDNLVLGAAAGYLHTASTLDEAGGRVTLNGYSVSAFGSYYQADRFYVDAIATYGRNDYGVTRNVSFADTSATAKSDPDGHQFAVSVSGGYNFIAGPLTVGPTAKVNYINVRINGFQEHGADIFNLRVDRQRVESLTTDLGAQLSYAISMPWGVLSPLARAEWEHEFKGGNRLITGGLAADPLRTVFGAPTNTPDRDYVNVALGLTATLPRGVSAFAHYETVLGRDRVSTHSFTAGLRFQFD